MSEEEIVLQRWTCPKCSSVRVQEAERPAPTCMRCETTVVMIVAAPEKKKDRRWNSLQMANNARGNKSKSPWRSRPHVPYAQNFTRHAEFKKEES